MSSLRGFSAMLSMTVVVAILWEALFWRLPSAFPVSIHSLHAECDEVKPGMSQDVVLTLFVAYDNAFRRQDSDLELIFVQRREECVVRLDKGSQKVVGAQLSEVKPDFGPEQQFTQGDRR